MMLFLETQTEERWNEMLQGEEQYYLDTSSSRVPSSFSSSFSYDILEASKRQESFFYQV